MLPFSFLLSIIADNDSSALSMLGAFSRAPRLDALLVNVCHMSRDASDAASAPDAHAPD